jgi:hypothetical protein
LSAAPAVGGGLGTGRPVHGDQLFALAQPRLQAVVAPAVVVAACRSQISFTCSFWRGKMLDGHPRLVRLPAR